MADELEEAGAISSSARRESTVHLTLSLGLRRAMSCCRPLYKLLQIQFRNQDFHAMPQQAGHGSSHAQATGHR